MKHDHGLPISGWAVPSPHVLRHAFAPASNWASRRGRRVTQKPDNLFTCVLCKGTYEKLRSDEEAMAEALADFPGTDPAMVQPVCDECYQMVTRDMAHAKRETLN